MANPSNSTAYRGNDGRLWVDVTEAKTLGIADSGFVQNVIYDNAVITLPATATQGLWIVRAGGVKPTGTPAGAVADGSMKLSLSPNASDKIQGAPDGSAVDDKDIILVKATQRVGDYAILQNTGETNGPVTIELSGVWSREA